MSSMDSIKGAIMLRARLEAMDTAAPAPAPSAEAGALPLFQWISPAPAAATEEDAAA